MGVQVVAVGSSVPEIAFITMIWPSWLRCPVDFAAIGYSRATPRPAGNGHQRPGNRGLQAVHRTLGRQSRRYRPGALGTYTPDMLLPATASTVQDKLGLRAPAFDIQAACASFIFALITGAQYVATGAAAWCS